MAYYYYYRIGGVALGVIGLAGGNIYYYSGKGERVG